MEIFTPYENASDMFVQNITHFFNNTIPGSTYYRLLCNIIGNNISHLLLTTKENILSGMFDGIYWTFYSIVFVLGVMCVMAPITFLNELINQPKKRNVTFIEPDYTEPEYTGPDYTGQVSAQKPPEPTFEEKYPHKFEHIIKFMDMFDYDCADDKYFKIFNRSTIPLNVNFENATENDFAKLVQLIKVNKIESVDDVFHIIMTDESFKMENDIAQFYYLLYSDYLADEFQDFREMIINIDC